MARFIQDANGNVIVGGNVHNSLIVSGPDIGTITARAVAFARGKSQS